MALPLPMIFQEHEQPIEKRIDASDETFPNQQTNEHNESVEKMCGVEVFRIESQH